MEIRPIRTDEDHRKALREVERFWGAEEGSPEGDKLDVLVTLLDAYEGRRWPMPVSSPLDVLRYAISDMGRSQAELANLLGSRSRATELQAGKRPLSLAMVRTISAAWHVPADLLVRPSAAA